MAENNDLEMNSVFYVGAVLKSGFVQVKSRFKELKPFRIVSDTAELRYEILEIKTERVTGLVELSRDHICLRFFIKEHDRSAYGKILLTFMTILALLKEDYEIKFDGIYGYIVTALNNNWHGAIKDQDQIIEGLKERIMSLDGSNCSLSHRLIGLSQENRKILQDLSVHRNFSSNIIGKLNGIGTGNNDYIQLTATDFELINIIKEL